MGNKYTEAQKKASLAYQRNKAQIKITTEKEQRDQIKKYAESKGLSVTDLFLNLVYEDMAKNADKIDKIYVSRPINLDKTPTDKEVLDKTVIDDN